MPTIQPWLRLLLSAVLVAGVLAWVPLDEVQRAIHAAAPSLLVLAIVLAQVGRVATGGRMLLLARMQGMVLRFRTMVHIVFASAFYGLFLPGGVAGGVVTFAKYRQFGSDTAQSATNVVVNKAFEVLSALTFAIFFRLWDLFHWHWLVLPLILLPAALLIFLTRASLRLAGGTVFRGGRADTAQPRWRTAWHAALDQAALLGRLGARQWMQLMVAALLVQGIGALTIYVFAASIGLSLSLVTIAWIQGCVALAALIPLTIANVGIREAVLLLLVAPLGHSGADVVAWSLVMYAGTLVAALIGAVGEVFHPLRWSGHSAPQDKDRDP